jgi:hypothetical protein
VRFHDILLASRVKWFICSFAVDVPTGEVGLPAFVRVASGAD